VSLYQVLGVRENATQADIKSAFRKLALQCHPDRHPGDKAKEDQFKRLSEAKEILSHPGRRARYDQAEKWRKVQAEHLRRTAPQPQPWRQSTAQTATHQGGAQAGRPQERAPSSPPQGQAQAAPRQDAQTAPRQDARVGEPMGQASKSVPLGGLTVYRQSRARWIPGTYWDPKVRRCRGPDGRFQPYLLGVSPPLR
jgi:curved DNA-binding protein CbpA